AEVVGSRRKLKAKRGTRVVAAGNVLDFAADRGSANILIGRDVNHPRLRAERDGRPVLPARQGWAMLHHVAGSGLVRRINIGTAGLRIEALEDVLLHERLAFDEVDLPVRTLEEPEV